MAAKVIIEVSGGVVQEVYSDDPDVDVILVDWDIDDQPARAVKFPTTPTHIMPAETQAAVSSAS